jgi:hypothetical protein
MHDFGLKLFSDALQQLNSTWESEVSEEQAQYYSGFQGKYYGSCYGITWAGRGIQGYGRFAERSSSIRQINTNGGSGTGGAASRASGDERRDCSARTSVSARSFTKKVQTFETW